jgi:hypothetical protein
VEGGKHIKSAPTIDEEFPPITLSLWHNPYDPPPEEEIVHPMNWRKLKDIAPDGKVRLWGSEGPQSKDIVQGKAYILLYLFLHLIVSLC